MLVDCPAVTPFARPDGVIVTALVSVEIQLTEFVMFDFDPLLEVPTAVNCSVLPAAIESPLALRRSRQVLLGWQFGSCGCLHSSP
jgi:hypothetical protein